MFFKEKKSATRSNLRSAKSGETLPTRVVAERRWVHRNQIEMGMYVNELDVPWEQTSFMFQGFIIDSEETLRAVQDACEYACVQTEKLATFSFKSVNRYVGASRT